MKLLMNLLRLLLPKKHRAEQWIWVDESPVGDHRDSLAAFRRQNN